MRRVAVLVLNYNGLRFLPPCLAALDRQEYRDFDTVVIDNASNDGSVEWLRAERPDVRVVVMPENLGFAGAYDRVIREAPHEMVAFLNNDAEPDGGWLGALVAALDGDGSCAAATSRIRFVADDRVLNHAGGAISPLGSGFDIGFGEGDGPAFEATRYCASPSGAASVIRREDYLAAGGFDPRYFAWFEDTDLGWRLWLRGRRVVYVPGASVRHYYGGTGGGRDSVLRIYHCQKNRLANATKNLEALGLVVALAAGMGYDVLRLLPPSGRPAALGAVLRGYIDYVRWLPALLRQRRWVQARRRRSDGQLRREGVLASWGESMRALRLAERYRKAHSRGAGG